VRVHSLTLSFTPELPLLAYNLASPYFGHEPKVRVVTPDGFPNLIGSKGQTHWIEKKIISLKRY
jgi:hypothetical protein